MIREFEGASPAVVDSCYIDPSAVVIGDVVIGKGSSVWPLAVIRGDVIIIRIDANTSIQDGSILHISHQGDFNAAGAELHIGDGVTVGHKALLHGCRIGNRCLTGMGAIAMDNVIIEEQVMVGSGSLTPPGKTLESGHLYLGNPVRKIRELTNREKQQLV